MGRIEKTVFISYRRSNFPWALNIYQDLTHHGFDVFFDYQSIDSGEFERVILENIKARAHFLVVLTPSALDRCKEPNDWLRREIETAIDEKRNIVPLMMEGFDFGSPLVVQALTGKLAFLSSKNGLPIYAAYFFEGMEKLRNRYLNVSLENISIQPLSAEFQELTEAYKTAAGKAPPVEKEQLTAQEWFERGYVFAENGNFDEAIRCYSKAIQFAPNRTEPYFNRGLIFGRNKDELANAITDFDEVIRLKPHDSDAYYNRGLSYSTKGDKLSALKDFKKAIELSPQDAKIRISLIGVLKAVGHSDEAILQEQIARSFIQKENEYNQACLEAVSGNTDKALRLLRVALEKNESMRNWAKRDPDFACLRDDSRFIELVGR
jgi:tetratricopeptide (TPR) repeat protein